MKYCEKLQLITDNCKGSYEEFLKPSYRKERDLGAFYILQIGELVSKLSDTLKKKYKDIPWQAIKGMRNVVAHKYGTIDLGILWRSLKNNVPQLNTICRGIAQSLNSNFHQEIEQDLAVELGEEYQAKKTLSPKEKLQQQMQQKAEQELGKGIQK